MSVYETCRNISELTPNAQKACNLFLEECKKQGLNVLITETYRSQERQNYLYEQGRTRQGQIVTWTKKSRHTNRRAWDICKNLKGHEYSDTQFFIKCGNVARELGIVWGGDWSTPDTPHFELPENWSYKGDEEPMTTEEKQKFNLLVEQLEKITKEVENLKTSKETIYHYTDSLPEYAKPTIQKLLNKGLYKGSGEADLNLPETLMRVLVINDRAGLYD